MNCVFKNKTRDSSWKQYYPLMNEIADAVEQQCQIEKKACVSVILVKKKRIHEINRQYRHLDRPTDVITFAASEGEVFDFDEEWELGDIFINVDAVVAQAKEYGHSEKREIGFLFVHGLLHCLGYDHMEEAEEQEMFALQRKILDPIVSR